MKVEIEITPEEFKELFVPGKAQQQFMEQMALEWQKNMTTAAAQFWSGGPHKPDLSSFWSPRKK